MGPQTTVTLIASNWMDSAEAVVYANGKISQRVLNRLCRNKKIRFGRNGKKYLFKPEFIDNYFLASGSGR
jgi:hypothetical protein